MAIEVRNLTKIYGEQKAIHNISFSLKKGEIVGFLGPNGAGKSTTMKIITGYLQADGGDATVCDIPVKENPLAAKKKIGYLAEANALYYDMYIREYLGFIAEVHHLNGQSKKRIEEVIKLTGLSVESRKKIGQLSKGYKQRVGLAAAFLHEPEVLILDEPTSGLDPNQIIEIRELIRQQGMNKTVLFSSHILQEVEAICDRVIIINHGEIVADDLLSNLKRNQQETHTVLVQFKEKVEASLFESLPAAISVISNSLSGSSGTEIKIQTMEPEVMRKQVFESALHHNLNIISLQSENQSLEDIFRLLTQTKNNPS